MAVKKTQGRAIHQYTYILIYISGSRGRAIEARHIMIYPQYVEE